MYIYVHIKTLKDVHVCMYWFTMLQMLDSVFLLIDYLILELLLSHVLAELCCTF
jgi:hypothetical protein